MDTLGMKMFHSGQVEALRLTSRTVDRGASIVVVVRIVHSPLVG